jgi:hypothetical protein
MKRSGFKMKNASIAKLAKTAGSPMRQSTEDIVKNLNEVVANSNTGKGANVNFGTAFSNARKSGKKTFDYKGKSYTTETKEEKANRTADVGPTVRNAKNNVDLSKTVSTKNNKKENNKKSEPKKSEPKKSDVMEGKKTLGDTKLGNVKVGKNKKRLADTKIGKAFSKGRAKGVAERKARAERMAAAKAERKAKRDANKK